MKLFNIIILAIAVVAAPLAYAGNNNCPASKDGTCCPCKVCNCKKRCDKQNCCPNCAKQCPASKDSKDNQKNKS